MRCVILDDYQDVARTYAAWDSLSGLEVTSLTEHLGPGALVRALRGAEVVVAMRERTPFPAALLERLPRLKLLVTTGMRNASIDLAATERLGITVCGTPSSPHPPVELTWALIHALTRHIVTEATGHTWQRTVGSDLHGRTLGLRRRDPSPRLRHRGQLPPLLRRRRREHRRLADRRPDPPADTDGRLRPARLSWSGAGRTAWWCRSSSGPSARGWGGRTRWSRCGCSACRGRSRCGHGRR